MKQIIFSYEVEMNNSNNLNWLRKRANIEILNVKYKHGKQEVNNKLIFKQPRYK